MAAAVFPDNTVLINFGTVDRLDLLAGWLRGRGRWTEAVADEARQSAQFVPAMQGLDGAGWLGTPIQIDSGKAIAEVERLRRNVFGGSIAEPRKHLGESQTCYLIKHDPAWVGSWWVSDDTDANEWAQFQGFVVRTTVGVIKELVADGDLTAENGYELLQAMVVAGRDNITLPQAPRDLLI